MLSLLKILRELHETEEYKNLTTWEDQNQLESYVLLGEILNTDNVFPYEYNKGYAEFVDDEGYIFFVRLTYNVTSSPYFELKMGWRNLEGQQKYLRREVRDIYERRTNTVAKIYRDELIPFFLSNTLSDTMKIFPLDNKRYQFSIRMLKKYNIDEKMEIIESPPKEITIKRK